MEKSVWWPQLATFNLIWMAYVRKEPPNSSQNRKPYREEGMKKVRNPILLFSLNFLAW